MTSTKDDSIGYAQVVKGVDTCVGDVSVIDQLLNEAGFGWFQIRLCFLCSVGYFAVGSELLTMVMTQSGVKSTFNIATSVEFSWLPFAANFMSFIASIFVGKVIDIHGRRWCFIGCISVSAIFALACSFATSFPLLIVLRSVVGFGLGGLTVIDYLVLVECCPERFRNTASQIVFVAGCLGVVYVALIGMCPLDHWFPSLEPWRVTMFFGGLPLLITSLIRVVVSTDTPKFLAACNRPADAYSLLSQMQGVNSKGFRFTHLSGVGSFSVSESEFIQRVKDEQALSGGDRGKLSEVLYMKKTYILGGIGIVQSLVYWGLTMFLPIFLYSAGVDPNLGLLVMGLSELPGVVIATTVSQRLNRESALVVCYSFSVAGALLTGSSVYFHLATGWILAGSILFYMFLIPAWGVLYVMTPEMYPVRMRGVAVGFHQMCRNAPSLFAPFLAASILESGLEGEFMYIWAAVLTVGLTLSVFLLPNRGKV